MRFTKSLRIGGIALVFMLTFRTTGCTSKDSFRQDLFAGIATANSEDKAHVLLGKALAGPAQQDDRILGTSDDEVIYGVEQILSSHTAQARWDGKA